MKPEERFHYDLLPQSPYILTRVKTADVDDDVDDDDDDDGHEVEENDHDDSSPQYVDSDHLHILGYLKNGRIRHFFC